MRNLFLLLILFSLAACNGSDPQLTPISKVTEVPAPEPAPIPVPTYSIGVFVEGLSANPVQLSLNSGTPISVTQNGVNFFPTELQLNAPFEVTISSQPSDRSCFVENGSGLVNGLTSNIKVKCSPIGTYYIGGLVSGLDDGLIEIQLATYETIRVQSGSTSYGFNWYVGNGTYNLTINNSNTTKVCRFVTNQGLTTNVAISGASKNDVNINCVVAGATNLSMTGTVTGITGSSLVIHTSNGTPITVNSDGVYSLGSFLENKRLVAEIISAPGRYCVFSESATHLFSATPTTNRSDINITCTPRSTSCSRASGEYPSTDATIADMECLNGTLALAGSFSAVGKQYGISSLDVTQSTLPSLSTSQDRIHGIINKIISDGNGGWFVGGAFARVGDKYKRNLVRLDSRLIIDESFDIEADGEVFDLDLDGNQLYVTGKFSNLIKGSTQYTRRVLGRISLATASPTVVNFEIQANGLTSTTTTSSFTTSVIDSNIYIHGAFYNLSTTDLPYLLNRRTGNLILTVNKNSGEAVGIASASTDLGRSAFWKDGTGTVWLLMHALGMVNAQTATLHPQNAKLTIGSNLRYHLDGSVLYMASPTGVKKIDLNLIETTTASNFGIQTFTNAADMVTSSTVICFFQNTDLASYLSINFGASIRYGVACFDKSAETLLSFSPFNYRQRITTGVLSNNRLISNTQFLTYNKHIATAFLNAETFAPSVHTNNLSAGNATFILSDGTDFYIGGNFLNYNNCASCDYLVKVFGTGLGTDTSWTFFPLLSGAMTAGAIDGSRIVVSTNITNRRMMAFDKSTLTIESFDSTNSYLYLTLHGSILWAGNGTTYSIRDTSALGTVASATAPTMDGPAFILDNKFMVFDLNNLYSRNDDGTLISSISAYPTQGVIETAKVGNSICGLRSNLLKCFDSSLNTLLTKDFQSNWGFNFMDAGGDYLFISANKSAPVIIPGP